MTDKSPVIVWDIDDVLTPTSLCFYNSVLDTHGECPHPSEWKEYFWGKYIQRDEGQGVADYLIKHRIIEETKPFSHTLEALLSIHQLGFKNVLLSARSWHPNPLSATLEWLFNHKLHYLVHEIHFVTTTESKKDKLTELSDRYDIKAFVEDNPKHALDAVSFIPQVFLVKKPWNDKHRHNNGLQCVATSLEAAETICVRHRRVFGK